MSNCDHRVCQSVNLISEVSKKPGADYEYAMNEELLCGTQMGTPPFQCQMGVTNVRHINKYGYLRDINRGHGAIDMALVQILGGLRDVCPICVVKYGVKTVY